MSNKGNILHRMLWEDVIFNLSIMKHYINIADKYNFLYVTVGSSLFFSTKLFIKLSFLLSKKHFPGISFRFGTDLIKTVTIRVNQIQPGSVGRG